MSFSTFRCKWFPECNPQFQCCRSLTLVRPAILGKTTEQWRNQTFSNNRWPEINNNHPFEWEIPISLFGHGDYTGRIFYVAVNRVLCICSYREYECRNVYRWARLVCFVLSVSKCKYSALEFSSLLIVERPLTRGIVNPQPHFILSK